MHVTPSHTIFHTKCISESGRSVQGFQVQKKSKCLGINVSGHSPWKSSVTSERQQLSIFPHTCQCWLPPLDGEIKHSHEKLQSSGLGMGHLSIFPHATFRKILNSGQVLNAKEKIKIYFFPDFIFFSDGVGRCLSASIWVANKKKTAVGQIRCGAADGHRPYHPHIYLSLNLTFNFILILIFWQIYNFSWLRLAALSPSTSLSSPRKIILRTWEILKSSPPKESASIRAGIWPNLEIF